MYSAKSDPIAISHRGLHSAFPENSIPAFEAAIEAGADGIELDVHASADDMLFVHHDQALPVGGSQVPFAEIDSAEISRLTLDGNVGIPTLDDALSKIGSRALVFIEIKAAGVENAVVRCLKRHIHNADRYAVHSFDHRVVKRLFELMPSVRTGILQVSYLVDSCSVMRKTGATDLWQHADFIDAKLVTDVHSCGGRVIAWTPDSEIRWSALADLGVDGICTDRVDAYVAWRTDGRGT
ncbi:MAG: glycerophosphodiester phosphodiesterase [Gemmatimonadaceae bacterium]